MSSTHFKFLSNPQSLIKEYSLHCREKSSKQYINLLRAYLQCDFPRRERARAEKCSKSLGEYILRSVLLTPLPPPLWHKSSDKLASLLRIRRAKSLHSSSRLKKPKLHFKRKRERERDKNRKN